MREGSERVSLLCDIFCSGCMPLVTVRTTSCIARNRYLGSWDLDCNVLPSGESWLVKFAEWSSFDS